MSKVHQALRSDNAGELPDGWYLRLPEGDRYGPARLDTLRDWAEQGRVPPGSRVSSDGQTWQPAETLPALAMDWDAHLPDGEVFGPFNLRAVLSVMEDVTLPDETLLVNRVDGYSCTLQAFRENGWEIPEIQEEEPDDADADTNQRVWMDLLADPVRTRDADQTIPADADSVEAKRPPPAGPGAQTDGLSEEFTRMRELLAAREQELLEWQQKAATEADKVREAERRASEAEQVATALEQQGARRHQEAQQRLLDLERGLRKAPVPGESNARNGACDLAEARARIVALEQDLQRERSKTSSRVDADLLARLESLRNARDELAERLRMQEESGREDALRQADVESRLQEETARAKSLEQQLATLQERYDPLQEEVRRQYDMIQNLEASLQQRQQEDRETQNGLQADHAALTDALALAERQKEELAAEIVDQKKQFDDELQRLQTSLTLKTDELTAFETQTRKERKRLDTQIAGLQARVDTILQDYQQTHDRLRAVKTAYRKLRRTGPAGAVAAGEEPSGEAERVAMLPPWLRLRRMPAVVGVLLLLLVLLFVLHNPTPSTPPAPARSGVAENTVVAESLAESQFEADLDEPLNGDLDPPPLSIPPAIEPAHHPDIAWPSFEIEGTLTQMQGEEMFIRFERGVFSGMTRLADGMDETLAAIARALRPHLDHFDLLVEGHTDALPLSSTSSFVDNYALGMARANTVRGHLVQDFGLPPQAVYAASAGETDPPFPEAGPEQQRINRTVVLRLKPRDASVTRGAKSADAP